MCVDKPASRVPWITVASGHMWRSDDGHVNDRCRSVNNRSVNEKTRPRWPGHTGAQVGVPPGSCLVLVGRYLMEIWEIDT